MKVEKDEFLIDGGKSAMMLLSCGSRKSMAANSRELDVRRD